MSSRVRGTVAAIALITAASTAAAQDAAPVGGLEEITVTAQKREENMQVVPVSVSAITEAGFERFSTPNIADLSGAIPNLYTQPTPGGSSIIAVSIRGIQYAENEKTFEPPVGVVLDGVFLGTAQGGLLQSFDLERLEVLRGPQGTLFGKNTTGGAINAVRTRPTGEFGGKVAATIGTFGRHEFRGVLNFPIIEGVLAGKIAVAYEDGTGVKNIVFPGRTDGDRDYLSASGTVLFTPSDNFELLLTYDHVRDRSESPAVYPIYQAGPTVLPTNPNIVLPPDTPCAALNFCPPKDFRHSRIAGSGIAHNDMNAITANARLDITDTIKLVSVTGWRDGTESIVNDFDATEVLIFETHRPNDNFEQFSQELRLEGEIGERVSFVAGLYYYDASYKSLITRFQDFGYIRGNPALIGVRSLLFPGAEISGQVNIDYGSKSYAAFAQVNVEVFDGLTITVGGRYTEDKKRMLYQILNPDGTITGPAQGATVPQSIDTRESWNKFTPRFSLSYQFDPETMAYASFTRGYNAGGYSGRAPDISTVGPYDPEVVDAYELGFKTDLLDNRLRFNAALFRNEYKDKQEEVTSNTTIPPFFGTSVANASEARIQGFEIETTAVPVDGLTLNASAGYLDAKYLDFVGNITGRGVTDNSGLSLRRTPKWTFSISGDYIIPVGDGEITLNARYRYIDQIELAVTNDPNGHVPSANYLDASISYGMVTGGIDWRIQLYGRNLTDTVRQNVYFRTGGFLSFAAANRGREGGVEVTVKF
ncbi:MAG: TonB-dependent receptor [Sphingomonadales bacterium]